MSDFASVWDEAGDRAEADNSLRALTAARVEAAAYWPFLAAAANREDFVNRLALKDAEIAAVAERQGITFEALVRSLAEDFHAVEAARAAEAPPVQATAARHLAIFKVTAADDSSAYYVVDEDSDKKVGGPYDSEADARDAISGGDVEGDNLTVSSGDGDSDSDDEKDSDNSDSDDSDDSDKDSDDDKGGNPFAKKESVRKTAHGDYEPYSHGQGGWKSGVGSYSHGDEDSAVGSAWKPHRVYDSIGSAANHLVGDERHPDQVSAGLESYNHCPSCDNVYSTNHPDHVTHGQKDQCPNCGDTDFHKSAADAYHESHAQDRDMYEQHGHPGEEDNYGDPYGRSDHHMQASRLFPIVALQDGEDPLEPIVEMVPDGMGEPEKPDEHNEDLVLTGSLVDRFRQVFTATLGK